MSVELTAKGRTLMQAAFVAHAARMEKAADGLNLRKRTELIVLLKKLGLNSQAQLDDDIDPRSPA